MTRLVLQAIELGENTQVLVDLHRICGEEEGSTWKPTSTKEIANRIFSTAYMGKSTTGPPFLATLSDPISSYAFLSYFYLARNRKHLTTFTPETLVKKQLLTEPYSGMEKNSSPQTRTRAADLAKVIGANHLGK
jgi:hypothetical protein